MTIDLLDELKARRLSLISMIVWGLVSYCPPLWRGKGEFGFFFFTRWGRAYVNRLAQELSKRMAPPEQVLFSFQTTTRFNAELPGIPHFVYIDTVETLKFADMRAPPSPSRLERDVIAHEQEIFAATSCVFTICGIVSDALRRDYGLPEDQVVTVYAGPNSTAPAEVRGPTPIRESPVILFVAVEWRRKGGDILVAAFREVLACFPDTRLWIVGVTPKEAASIPNCTLWGLQSKQQVGVLLRQASIFCLPSRRDFFPISLIEAMASGLPVVATATGGVPEMVKDGETGFVVPVEDSKAVAAALTRLVADPSLRERMGHDANVFVTEHLNWKKVGARMGHVIRTHLRSESR